MRRPKVLIVDEPTQGVDARARMDIYRVLSGAADEGIAVLVNSSDSAELEGLCDRIYVMSRGNVVRELTGPTGFSGFPGLSLVPDLDPGDAPQAKPKPKPATKAAPKPRPDRAAT